MQGQSLTEQAAEGADQLFPSTMSYEDAGRLILEGIKSEKLFIHTHKEQSIALYQGWIDENMDGFGAADM